MRWLVIVAGLALAGTAQAEDAAKKACYPDAKRLCSKEVHAFNRPAVEACLYRQIEQTSPLCHQMIDQVHAQRTAKKK